MISTDCLVLCIDDFISSKLFVLYDTKNKIYELRGKNYDIVENNSQEDSDSEESQYANSEHEDKSKTSENIIYFKPYSFKSCKLSQLMNFIEYLISINSCQMTVYNYDNLAEFSNQITFDFLEKHIDCRYEIFNYENKTLDKKICRKMLKMIKHIYNDY